MRLRGGAAISIDGLSRTFMGTLMPRYNSGNEARFSVDLVAGARVCDVSTTVDPRGGSLSGRPTGDGDTSVDPVMGVKFRHAFDDGFYPAGWAFVCGLGVSSDSLSDVMAGVGYDFNDRHSAFGNYRAVSVDCASDGFVWDVKQKGPIIGAVFRF